MTRRAGLVGFWLAAIALCSVGLLYITWKAFLNTEHQGAGQGLVDFRIFWLAGRLWWQGQSPYDYGRFQAENQAQFGDLSADIIDPAANLFPYFPYSSLVFLPLGAFNFSLAFALWNGVNYALLLAAIALSWRLARGCEPLLPRSWLPKRAASLPRTPPQRLEEGASEKKSAAAKSPENSQPRSRRDPRGYWSAFYFSTFQGTAMTFFLGQTSLLASFGWLVAIAAAQQPLRGWCWLLGSLGVYLLLLKPQLAVVLLAALLAGGRYRLLLGGGAIALVGWLVAIARSSFAASTTDFVAILARYHSIAPNQPERLTGLVHLLDYLGWSLPPPVILGLGLAFGGAIGWRWLRAGFAAANLAPELAIALLLAATFLMPLHVNDLLLSGTLAAIALTRPWSQSWLLAPGLLLLWRAGNWSSLLNWYHPATEPGDANLLASVAIVLLLAGTLALTYRNTLLQNRVR